MGSVKREGVVYGMPEQEYHAPKDELSSTGAKLLLESPAKFKYQVLDGNRVHRDAYDLGTAVHTKVLGTGAQPVTCPPELLSSNGAMTTAAAKAWKAEQIEAGIPVVTVAELAKVEAMAEAVLAYQPARMLFERPGNPEVSVFDEFLGVKRRCRFDYLPDDGGIAVDLKTTVDASTGGFARSAAKYGYHLARGMYLHILKQVTGRDVDMLFVAVEKEPPYLVAVHRLSPEFAEMGETEALEAVDVYRRCMLSGEWPGYPAVVNMLEPPMFAVYDYQDKYEREEMSL